METVVDGAKNRRMTVALTAVLTVFLFVMSFSIQVQAAEAKYPDAVRKVFVKGCSETKVPNLSVARLKRVCKAAISCAEKKVSLNSYFNYLLALREGRKVNAEVRRKLNRCTTKALYKELSRRKA